MANLRQTQMVCIAFTFSLVTAVASHAQTFTTLQDLLLNHYPAYGSLVQGTDGTFYGTTDSGGATDWGTVFKITSSGQLTTLHSFCLKRNCGDGALGDYGLVLATEGDLYGTTTSGGFNGNGTVFKITRAGSFSTLHRFNGTDGATPAGLLRGIDGNFYGTTQFGGPKDYGTVFKITPTGALTTLHSFSLSDGAYPIAGVVQATDGNFYGTTFFGGSDQIDCPTGCGTVFRITPSGILTTLHSFAWTDGAFPFTGQLVQATDGNLYGTTNAGGSSQVGCFPACGTVFKINRAGTLTTLYSFCSQIGCLDGEEPFAGLVQATNGKFYGTTSGGGDNAIDCAFIGIGNGCGTVFEITPGGRLTTLHSFDYADGLNPTAGLVQGTDGSFYGTTSDGGANGNGTVFRLSVGIVPFVETEPRSGTPGTDVIILGNNLTGTTSVTFNKTAATFTVVSNTEIRTSVPTRATSGIVTVTTPRHTLRSNVRFRVTHSHPSSRELGLGWMHDRELTVQE